ncbi:hypothetical protein [Streptomyces sp. CBMA370]|uniref:hypothetical protein n=1 Tax=Streptomyces sp. CBMA370 TaxID=1930278 RepID=UPI001661C41D|nr:hypothetical protein [Streptomyces sp. CBMA370]MBD0712583.1 hypothetical protein [Streptomyces sp. CBMA370]
MTREALTRLALNFGPCECGSSLCPMTEKTTVADDGEPEHARADDRSFSPTMQRLRPLVENENRRTGSRRYA